MRRFVPGVSILVVVFLLSCQNAWPDDFGDADSTTVDAEAEQPGDGGADADSDIPSGEDGGDRDDAGHSETGPDGDADAELDSGRDADAEAVPDDSGCLRIEEYDFTKSGGFSVEKTTKGSVHIYTPRDLPAGCKVPVIHFSNGTGARCRFYDSILRRLTSYGFISACYESTETGSGEPCMTALETVFESYPDIAAYKVGSTGHSQGGGAAITCTYLAEQRWGGMGIAAAHAIEPANGMNRPTYVDEYPLIESPVFIMTGSEDWLVSETWVRPAYDLLESEVYWYRAVGAGHFDPHEWASVSAVAWFRWKLLGDERAGEYFLALPESELWEVVESP